MLDKGIRALSSALHNKEFSSTELTGEYLNLIKQKNDELNCYITVTDELALQQAAQADEQLNNGTAGTLTGIPFAHKDIFCTKGTLTSCGSKMLENFISPYNATVIEKFNQAGAVTLGKTNMDEFAMGSSNETSFFGSVKNPWNHELVPGGSSGG